MEILSERYFYLYVHTYVVRAGHVVCVRARVFVVRFTLVRCASEEPDQVECSDEVFCPVRSFKDIQRS